MKQRLRLKGKKWRKLVVKEEREERERKRKIESLQKLIERETQRAHLRYHTDVNSARSSMHIPSSHKDSSKTPCCSSATNITEPDVAVDVLFNVPEASHTFFDQPERVSAAISIDQQEVCYIDVDDQLLPDRKDDTAPKDVDSTNNTTEQPAIETGSRQQTDPTSVATDVEVVPYHDTTPTADKVELATTAEVQDAAFVLTEDDETKTEHYSIESKDPAADRVNAEHLQTVSPYAEASTSAQQWSITEPPVQDTVAALITQPAADKSGAAPTVLQLTTELQIQHTDDAVITHPEASEESDATPTVELTTDVTKTQQCYSTKELQTQDTDVDSVVSMTQPTATQDSGTIYVIQMASTRHQNP